MFALGLMWAVSLAVVWFVRGKRRAVVPRCLSCASLGSGPREFVVRRATAREEAAELDRVRRERDAARKKARYWMKFADRAWKHRGGR